MEELKRLRSYSVIECDRETARDLIEVWHYSKSILGVNSEYCFALQRPDGLLAGAAVLGPPAGREVYRKYSERSKWDLIEIRRLACIDDTPRNAESYFIGGILRWLKRNTRYHRVLAFSDGRQGHTGVIYKASNFRLFDIVEAKSILYDGRLFHPRVLNRRGPTAEEVQRAHNEGRTQWVKGDLYAYVRDLVDIPIHRDRSVPLPTGSTTLT